jgi:glutamate synthase domain-containing protein 1
MGAEPSKQGLYDPYYEHDACGVGFVVNLKGRKSHALVQQAIQVLLNLEHRGACGCEKNTGDGAGILLQTPHRFLAQECDKLGIALPEYGAYGVGLVFLPTDADDRQQCEQIFEQIVAEEGCTVLGWRTVPTDNSTLGPSARAVQPMIRQIFISRSTPAGTPRCCGVVARPAHNLAGG